MLIVSAGNTVDAKHHKLSVLLVIKIKVVKVFTSRFCVFAYKQIKKSL